MTTINTSLMTQLGLIPSAASSSSTAANNSSTSALGSSSLSQSDFLTLMTTQLDNQNPTQPMDSSQFMSQISQFSMVSGIQDMQGSIQQMLSSFVSNQTMQAASLVGHEIVATGSNATLPTGGVLSGAVDLTSNANDVSVGIYDTSGNLVNTIDLGAQSTGTIPFSWNGATSSGGTAPSGVYTVKAQASVGGTSTAMTTYVASTVNSVSINPTNQQIILNTSGGEAVNMSDVQQIM